MSLKHLLCIHIMVVSRRHRNFTLNNIMVCHGGFTICCKQHTFGLKNNRDQILAQTIPSYNILCKLHFSEAQRLHLKNQDKIIYLSGLLLYFFSASIIGFFVLICNPNKGACSSNFCSWANNLFCLFTFVLADSIHSQSLLVQCIYLWIPRWSYKGGYISGVWNFPQDTFTGLIPQASHTESAWFSSSSLLHAIPHLYSILPRPSSSLY